MWNNNLFWCVSCVWQQSSSALMWDCKTVFIFSSSSLLTLLTPTNNFLLVHQSNRQQYIITGLIESHEVAKSSCPSLVSCKDSFFREKMKGGKKSKRQKKESGRPNFTNSQTDIGYMGKGGTAAVHSRRGRDVSEWWKQEWTVCCPSVLLADKNHQPVEMPEHLGSANGVAVRGVTQLFLMVLVWLRSERFAMWFLTILINVQSKQIRKKS